MRIDYTNSKLISKTMQFDGVTSDGLEFTIFANWNDHDDWNVEPEEVSWDGEEGTEEQVQEIIEQFLKEMNG